MNPKIIKILRKANDQELLKLPAVRKETARINALLKPYQLDRTVKTARDVYTLSILEEGLKNKQKIEELYEQTRREMLDIWDMLDYPKRNEFVRPKIQAAIAEMKQFSSEGKLIMIPFFDPLINALYDHETAVLELPQFFKMYKNFADKIVDPLIYGRLPYEAGFASPQVIFQNELGFAVYEGRVHCLEIFAFDGTETELPLSLVCTGQKLDPAQGAPLAAAVLSQDPTQIRDALCASGYVLPKLKSKIARIHRP